VESVIIARTVAVPDPFAHANVLEALAGPGAPAGILTCTSEGESVVVTFEAERTAPELIDAIIAVETVLVPARARAVTDPQAAAAVAARGLAEPDLDAGRIIETYLP
jgi:hypothetical protein